MTIKIARGVVSHIRDNPDAIVIMVRDAEDEGVAADALRSATGDICRLDGGWRSAPGLRPGIPNSPKWVSEVFPTPAGPMVMIDGGYVPGRLLRTIPAIVQRHLESAGIEDATIAAPRFGGEFIDVFWGSDQPTRVVQLSLSPLPGPTVWHPRAVPDEWLAAAASFLQARTQEGDDLRVMIVATEFPFAASEVEAFLHQARATLAQGILVVIGAPPGRFRGIAANFAGGGLSMAAGGDDSSDDDLEDHFDELVKVARRLARDVGYATVSVDPVAGCFRSCMPSNDPFGPWDHKVGFINDEYVSDAYAYQILSPGHLARLGGSLPGGRSLGGGRVELFVGRPLDWVSDLPAEWTRNTVANSEGWMAAYEDRYRRNPQVRTSAYGVLEPCLIPREGAQALIDARYFPMRGKQ